MPAELCVQPRGCINKIMMSHLTLHPKSGANYLCLYCLMTETRTGPLPPAGTKTGRSREAILRLWVCRLTEAICQAGIQAPSPPPGTPIAGCPPAHTPAPLMSADSLHLMIPTPSVISWP